MGNGQQCKQQLLCTHAEHMLMMQLCNSITVLSICNSITYAVQLCSTQDINEYHALIYMHGVPIEYGFFYLYMQYIHI